MALRWMPPPSEKTLAMCLALIAGYVDACGLRVFGTYVSFMSGNTTHTGVLLGRRQLVAAMPFLIAIVFFVGGSFVGVWLNHWAVRRPRPLLFTAVATLLGSMIVSMQYSIHPRIWIAMLALAMGMMNTTLSQIESESVSLTFVTGNLSRIGRHLALALKSALVEDADSSHAHLRHAFLLSSVWLAVLSGAVLSGTAVVYFPQWMLLPPFLLLMALAVMTGRRPSAARDSRP